MSPNIRRTTHDDCSRLEFTSNGNWADNGWRGSAGDVRVCVHGKLQVRTEASVHSRVQGPGTDWWRTLSPIFDPFTYRRARKALA